MARLAKVGLFLALVLVGGFYGYLRFINRSDASVQSFRTTAVTRGEILRVVISTGTVKPLNTVSVGSQISGNVKHIFTDFNLPVRKNQTIALIDDAVYAAQVEQARARLEMAEAQRREREKDVLAARVAITSAEASLYSAQATMKHAETQYQRMKNMSERQLITKAELEAAETSLDVSRGALNVAAARVQSAIVQLEQTQSTIKAAEANIADRRAALDLERIKLNYCTIVSPIDGVVIHRDVDVGQTVAATLQSPTLFTIAEDLSRMQLEIDVSEADVGQIHQGQPVSFTVDAFPDDTFQAEVQQIRNTPTSLQNVVTYKVVAAVDNTSLKLRPGMTANVTIQIARVDEVLKVGNAALRFRPAGETTGPPPTEAAGRDSNQLLTRLTEQLQLTAQQKRQLETILQAERQSIQGRLQATSDPEQRREAARGVLPRVFTQLAPLLTAEQSEKLSRLASQRQAAPPERRIAAKPGTVYIVGADRQPQAVRVLIGIANETETQIISRDLQAGDQVIVGTAFNAGTAGSSSTTNPFLPGRRPGR
jgi:HlyD family secretion protein